MNNFIHKKHPNFGSFINDDYELLIKQSELELHNNIINLMVKHDNNIKMDYKISKKITFLNNGAFGLAMNDIIKLSYKILKYIEKTH